MVEFDIIDKAIDHISRAFQDIHRFNEQIEHEQEKLIAHMLSDLSTVTSSEDKSEIVHQYYWYANPILPVEQIAAALNVSLNQVSRIAGPFEGETYCEECGGSIEVFFKSRASHNKHFTCEPCKQAELEQRRKRNEDWKAYQAQEQAQLYQLKTMPYAQYLRTGHWDTVRKAALKRAGFRCEVCNSAAPLQVHHRTYKNRGEERNQDLIALCGDCHQIFHDNGKLAKE